MWEGKALTKGGMEGQVRCKGDIDSPLKAIDFMAVTCICVDVALFLVVRHWCLRGVFRSV